ncbi:MAG: Cof-type HAD-IIB family hydrolase [Lachnospiraceae bacterium]|nr:Cof-type HAD-IIB family hydrolase [Lachnospiraceae bacterium]
MNTGKKKALALDLDGTLLTSDKKISPLTREKLEALLGAGHVLILASGRPTPGMRFVVKDLGFHRPGCCMVTYNGAYVQDCGTGEVLFDKTLPASVPGELFRLLRQERPLPGLITYLDTEILSAFPENEFTARTSRNNAMPVRVVPDFDTYVDFPVHKCMITAPEETAARLERKLKEVYGETLSICRSESYFLEVMPAGTSKAAGLAMVLDYLGMGPEALVCCGDGENDIPMIRYAGVGVAMGNARESVKAAADFVTGSNDEDGLAQVVDRYF